MCLGSSAHSLVDNVVDISLTISLVLLLAVLLAVLLATPLAFRSVQQHYSAAADAARSG